MNRSLYVVLALMSITLIGMELIWTRIFSAEFYYTFAFLVLSLAVLGLGLGALALRLFPGLDRDRLLGVYLTLSGLMAVAGPVLVFKLGLDFSLLISEPSMTIRFVGAVVLLSSTFFLGGVALAMLFKRHHELMPRLYMADLIGAGCGVAVAIWAMNQFQTPAAAFLCAVPILVAALFCGHKWLRVIPAVLIVVLVFLSPQAADVLRVERQERAPVLYRHWDAMSSIKVYDYSPAYRGIEIDNAANSPVYAFDGNWDRPDSLRYQFGISVDYLINQFDSCRFLSLGSGGGVDVLQALQEGATDIHAVEVNGHVNEMMTTGVLADFTGYIYDDPRVTVASEDARAYVRAHPNSFDVIYSLSSNTFSALASGSFALAENYLFTVDAFEDYWRCLSDSGFMMMEHQFYMPRLVSEVMVALERQGVEKVTDHFAVYNLPQMRRNILLLSKRPLDDTLRYHAFFDLTPEVADYIHLLYPAPDSLKDNLVNRVVTEGWEAVAPEAPIAIDPCDDNRPFTAQLGLFRNFSMDKLESIRPYDFLGFPLSQTIVLTILGIVLLLVLPLNLLPYVSRRERLAATPWLYFLTIGIAYMGIEVVLIQKFALLVGPSVYSISAILLALLVSSGIGSRFADRLGRRAVFGGVVVWLLLLIVGFDLLVSIAGSLSMPVRVMAAILATAPLGFFMGMPFPKGALRVKRLVDWAFAVNGAASVLGSALAILLASTIGFNLTLFGGVLAYVVAFILYRQSSGWAPIPGKSEPIPATQQSGRSLTEPTA